MKYCKNCLEVDTRPRTKFNKEGLCSACTYKKKQSNLSDEKRIELLKKIFIKFKSHEKYDCIIGVSGGKDSTRQAVWLRDKLNINPLLVCCTYPPDQITTAGHENLSNLISLGFDVIVSGPSPNIWKKVLKEGFFKGNYLKGPEIALFSSVPQIAIKYGIRLIIWGESPGYIWNNEKVKRKLPYDGNSLKYSNTISGCDLNWSKVFLENPEKLTPYIYPSDKEFKKNKIQIIFLEYFSNNWSVINNAKISSTYGLKIRKDNAKNTGDLYGVMALDDDWVSLNQMIKYLKFGFGRASDYLNYEIRAGRIKRDDAIKIVKKYDGKCSKKYIKSFCNYISISEKDFWKQIDKFVNKKLFYKSNKGEYLPKFKVGENIE